ncbi:MAG: T9SS type A sorting domain-containing protein [Winogradskyella sp.]|uniref:endonuclease n=1 Tax=Winogradskyella sp. TaxID=1883156 RepID=UPI0018157E84|nr:T9SS type A sorting domain-containing protein [Winogradskyella sp.]
MKHLYLLFLLTSIVSFGQIPSDYYDSANGLSGYNLKTELSNITTNGHNAGTYDQLYDGNGISGSNGYVDTHSDINVTGGSNYENDGTVLDFYSENPTGSDPYNFFHNVDNGGNQTAEGDCYNREHLVPQSSFNSAFPMQSDIHHVIPTDCRVNNFRGSLPFGNVASPNFTSQNGSQRGTSAMSGYSGLVFEPIDEFKGDIARALLYFAVRYEGTVDGYTSFDMFNGTEDQVFFPWAIDVLLDWHYNIDPVDQRERNRNNAAYNFQGNANPFVDHPEYADLIWNPNPDTESPTAPTNLVASNPTDNSIQLNWSAASDNVGVTSYDIYVDGGLITNSVSTSATVDGLNLSTTYCFTIKAKDDAGNESGFSNQDCETTTNNGSGADCASEDFANIPNSNNSSYLDRTWSGSNGVWNATEARTDQVINGNAITIDCRNATNGTLSSPTISGGIGDLTLTTQRVFTGTDGTLDVFVNGNQVGTIGYSNTQQTETISGINIEGNVQVVIKDNNSGSARIALDDLTWTCNNALGVKENTEDMFSIYPNPVISDITIQLKYKDSTTVEVFDILGKRIIFKNINETTILNMRSLRSGVYILKISQGIKSISKRLLKN